MGDELYNAGAQQDLQHLMSLKEKKRSRMIVDWPLGEDLGRKALAERLLLSDRSASAKLLVASALARWTKLSRRLHLLAAITRLGLQIETDEVFNLLSGGSRFGDPFREQAVMMVRKKHSDDEMAMRSAAATESATPVRAAPMVAR